MAFRRIFAVLLGMIMTVEAVPAVVLAKETDISSKDVISAEEEETERTEAVEAPVSETTVKKEKEPSAEETKKETEKEPAPTETIETEAPEDTKETETADKAPAETETSETSEKESEEPEETEESKASDGKKESGDKEPDETASGESTGKEDKEPEPSATVGKEIAGSDNKVPSDSDDQEEAPLKDGEVAYEAGDIPFETHIPSKTSDNDKQLESYFKKKAQEALNRNRPVLRKAAPSAMAAGKLGGYNRIVYDSFRKQIADVAKGLTNSTEFEVPISEFGLGLENMSWTKEDLEVSRLTYVGSDNKVYVDEKAANAIREKYVIPINISAIDDALLADCPFDFYWFDKTKGVICYSYTISSFTVNGVTKLRISHGPTGTFAVSKDYYLPGTLNKYGISYTTDPSKIGRVNTAVSNAAAVVKNAESKTDYQKLVYYCNEIMARVQYNTAAAGTGSTNYGDPWQLISVFDGDSSTNVVCEGYSKAFMYLCELTDFKGNISCITVTGEIPAGGHMWNVVNMDDGKNYLVDVTNIDGRGNSTEAYFKALFLAGYTNKVSTTAYEFSRIKYLYDSETLSTYTSNQIAIHSQNYYIPRSVTAKSTNGKVTLSKTSAYPDEEISFTVEPDAGYKVESYTLNGTEISNTKFLMTGVPAVVGVVYKQVPYKVTVHCGEHGSANANTDMAGVGDVITLNIAPEDGYYLKSVTVNGTPVNGNTFKMLPEDVTVEIEFDQISQAAVGEILSDGINNYKVINNAMDGTGTVAFAGSANHAAGVTVPAVATLKGIYYNVTKIASWAFNRNTDVTSVYIGANVTVIETNAFVGCTKLVKISGGYRLKTISSKAIISCAKLKSFSITSPVLSTIGSYAFKGDKSLKTIYINKTTKLSKKRVKKSLKGSSVKTVKVKKSKVKKYKKYFTKKNCGRKVKVKK